MPDHSRLFRRARRPTMLILLVLMFITAAFAPRIFITIPSGQAGVLWLYFFGGTDVSRPALAEGLHVIFPWDRIYLYSMRMQSQQENFEVISKDGLHFDVAVNARWRLVARTLPSLHRDVGPDYEHVLLLPEIGSVARTVIARFDTESVYSTDRRIIEQEIYKIIVSEERTNRIGPVDAAVVNATDNVALIDVLVTKISLPPRIQAAIANKLEQLLISEEYQFRLRTEVSEADRKLIEARGIQAFQQTVQAGISDNYLKWRGIEATLKLATSPNAKVVVIGGGGSQGLPLILNTGDTATPAPALPPAPGATPPQSAGPTSSLSPSAASPGSAPSTAESQVSPQPAVRPADMLRDAPALLRGLAGSLDYRLEPPPPRDAAVLPASRTP